MRECWSGVSEGGEGVERARRPVRVVWRWSWWWMVGSVVEVVGLVRDETRLLEGGLIGLTGRLSRLRLAVRTHWLGLKVPVGCL